MHTVIKLIVLNATLIMFSLPNRSKQNRKKPKHYWMFCQPLSWMLCSHLAFAIILCCRYYYPTLQMKKLRIHEPEGIISREKNWNLNPKHVLISKSVFLTTVPPLSGCRSTLELSPCSSVLSSKTSLFGPSAPFKILFIVLFKLNFTFF